ncbi:metallophosphoesterase [Variovorax sp. E3]|uniref:metallophosphoesterase n=1 Tax=Variovorax sp. E3 TaxID=1914993 RepID=UPI0018DCF685|nr:metallophosphoesterase [Variovorax sp. E3]
MKLLVLSDLHLEFEQFELDGKVEFDVVILAGDIHSPGRHAIAWAAECFPGKPVVLVAGNHEYFGSVMHEELAEIRRQAKVVGVGFLDCDEIVIDGVRFLGCTLWTDFALRIDDPGFPGRPMRMLSDRHRAMAESARFLPDYAEICVTDPKACTWMSSLHGARRLTPMDTLLLHRRQRAWLRRKLGEPFSGPTVVVTHHAPHRLSLAPKHAQEWSSGGYVNEMLPTLFEVPALWIHGHTHQSFDYYVDRCRVVSNPRGYVNWHGDAENGAFNPGLVIDVPQEGDGYAR